MPPRWATMLDLVLGVRPLILAWILFYWMVSGSYMMLGTECPLLVHRRGLVLVPHTLDGCPFFRSPLVMFSSLCTMGQF